MLAEGTGGGWNSVNVRESTVEGGVGDVVGAINEGYGDTPHKDNDVGCSVLAQSLALQLGTGGRIGGSHPGTSIRM